MSSLLRKLGWFWQRRRKEADLDEELQAYLNEEIGERLAKGMSREEAERTARLELGNLAVVKEDTRAAWGWRMLDLFLLDAWAAARSLTRDMRLNVVILCILALGVGANTTMFSMVNGYLLKRTFPDEDRLVLINESYLPDAPSFTVAPGNFLTWKKESKSFENMATLTDRRFTLLEGGAPQSVAGEVVNASFFPTLGIEPSLGRNFSADEDRPGGEEVVILSRRLWRQRFSSDPQIIGRKIRVDSRLLSVVGVIDTEAFDNDTELWVPAAFSAEDEANHGGHGLQVFGRLNPGVSIQTATAELKDIARRLETAHPETNKGWSIVVTTARDALVGDYRTVILVLWGVVGFVLLIACANIANLLLARSMSRRRDVAIRLAVGASRFQIVRQLLAESIALAIAGGAAGLMLSHWTLRLLTLLDSGPSGIHLDWIVFGFTSVLCVITGILFGLIPALDLSRTDLNECLKDGSRSASGSRSRHRIRNALVVAEVSLSLVLLIGAALMMRSFMKLSLVSPGFNAENVLVGEVTFSSEKYKGPEDVVRFTDLALAEISTLPGVLTVTASDIVPFGGGSSFYMRIEGRPGPNEDLGPGVSYLAVSPRYFKAMEIPIKRGREFTPDDKTGSKLVTVVNETFARQFFPNEEIIGKRIWISHRTEEYREIIGVVGDTKQAGLNGTVRPQVYETLAQMPWPYLTFVVKTIDNPMALAQSIEKRIQKVDSEQAVIIRSLTTIVDSSVADQRVVTISFAVFAGIALLIASTGLYGVIAHSVDQRTREIGLCMALGADRVRLLGEVLRQGLSLIAVGLLLGIAAAFALTRLLDSFLFQTSATDSTTFVGISAILALISLIACYVPARRASNVHPAAALRHE